MAQQKPMFKQGIRSNTHPTLNKCTNMKYTMQILDHNSIIWRNYLWEKMSAYLKEVANTQTTVASNEWLQAPPSTMWVSERIYVSWTFERYIIHARQTFLCWAAKQNQIWAQTSDILEWKKHFVKKTIMTSKPPSNNMFIPPSAFEIGGAHTFT